MSKGFSLEQALARAADRIEDGSGDVRGARQVPFEGARERIQAARPALDLRVGVNSRETILARVLDNESGAPPRNAKLANVSAELLARELLKAQGLL